MHPNYLKFINLNYAAVAAFPFVLSLLALSMHLVPSPGGLRRVLGLSAEAISQ